MGHRLHLTGTLEQKWVPKLWHGCLARSKSAPDMVYRTLPLDCLLDWWAATPVLVINRKEINYSRQRSICARGLILSMMFLNLGVYSSKSVLKISSYIQSLILNSRVLFLMEDFSAKSQNITLHPMFQNKCFPLELSVEE